MDPNIKWEATRAFNIGLDFGFSNQRITGAIDWYDKTTNDLLFDVPGRRVQQPVEFRRHQYRQHAEPRDRNEPGARVLQGGGSGLTWQADFTAAHNTNELRSITPFGGSALKILTGDVSGGVGTSIQVFAPGVPINSFYVYEHIRGANGKPIYQDRMGTG